MQIPIEQIEGNPHRISTELETLEESLLSEGQLSPIRLRPHPSMEGKFLVIFGNRRLEAARRLHWKTIEAIVCPASDSQSLFMALSENIQRDDFSDYEKGLLIEKIHSLENKSYAEIAKQIGKSLAYVYQHTAMLRLFPENVAPSSERMKVLSLLSEKQARVMLRIGEPRERWTTAKLAISANLCVRELERLIAGTKKRKRKANSTQAIEQIIKSIVRGLNNGDLTPHFEVLSDHYMMFPSLPPYIKMDRETTIQYMCSMVRKSENFGLDDLDVKIIGKFAYASMQVPWQMSFMGKKIRVKARASLIFAKEDRWKILHEHWSLSNPMDVLEFILANKSLLVRSEK
jgi:ParB/RepB/Spo0J family partition protein